MIYFFADNHFNTHAGKNIFHALTPALQERVRFFEDDFTLLEEGAWADNCDLLILHLIGNTCGLPHPGSGAEKAVKKYCQQGGNLLLLHGSSAAFWQWEWWRHITGVRWVRPKDPDGVEPSVHPHGECSLTVCKCRHELANKLRPFELPEDEVYTALEQTSPALFLMMGTVNGQSFPQCCESYTPWGGKVINFIPGHKENCVKTPALTDNVEILIRYLTNCPEQV
ncbi:MAG: ThuA domain-containing protein [Lentisphaerae bacterium]|nr:ThuA domain-containing protein [Lentisphaerota bacterium]